MRPTAPNFFRRSAAGLRALLVLALTTLFTSAIERLEAREPLPVGRDALTPTSVVEEARPRSTDSGDPHLATNLDPRSVFDPRNGRPLQIVIADTKLTIPSNYFDSATVPRSVDQVDMLLHAFMPGMEPVRDDTMQEFRTTHGQGRRAQMLVGDARSTTNLKFRLETQLKLAAPVTRSSQYGLDVYQSVIDTTPRAFRMEVLASKSEETPDDLVVCNIDGQVPFPGCSHEFVDGNFLVRVTYGKRYLPQWRAVRELTMQLLTAFSQNH